MQTGLDVGNIEDYTNQQAADRNLMVKFEYKTRPDVAETEKQGHPVFKEVEYVTIRQIGQRDPLVSRPVRPRDMARFAKAYDHFKANTEAPVEGMPLEEWPAMTRSMVETFKYYNIRTVEDLANCGDGQISQFMGGNTWKAKAQKYLDMSATSVEDLEAQFKEEIKAKDDTIAEMKAMIEELKSDMAALAEKKAEPESTGGAKRSKRKVATEDE